MKKILFLVWFLYVLVVGFSRKHQLKKMPLKLNSRALHLSLIVEEWNQQKNKKKEPMKP